MKHVVIENHIPDIKGLVEPWAHVTYLPPEAFTPNAVCDADAIVVRTRTRCDASLLAGSRVKLIATATIGTDHIDLDYCAGHGIAVANAPGCNAPAVAQWVWAVIGRWLQKRDLGSLTLGVVGVGHVGSIVARWARQLGMQVLLNDPPRERAEGVGLFVSLDQLLCSSDIVTVHTPLTHDGIDATWHLIDRDALSQMTRCQLLLNAARGGIVDESALSSWSGDVAIDCWQGEPRINPATLERAWVATPHIAGYSIEGKQRGTAMVIEALNRHFGWQIPMKAVSPACGIDHPKLSSIMSGYDPLVDTRALRTRPEAFEELRNNYALRHEPAEE